MRDMAASKDMPDGVTFVGISPDSVDRQAKFAEKSSVNYSLLSDADHTVAEKYGAWGLKKLYGKEYEGIIRSAFLVGTNGKIEGAWYKVKPADTPKRLLESLA